ncbi:MAG: prepilin-type N-terminal cleavage/methylation domain-containing protein [Vicinamibacterales bacterium]
MTRSRFRARRGFSVIEIITSLVIVAILGVAMTKLILGQARGFQFDNGGRKARAAARSAMNIIITDLRMGQDANSIEYIDPTNNRRIDVRVPLVFGIVCEVNPTNAVLALVPVDSFQMAAAKYGGYAVRIAATGNYSYSASGASDTIQTAAVSRCHGGPNIWADTVTASGRSGRVVTVSPAPPAGTVVGAPAFVYHTVAYYFSNSAAYPGAYGLYRYIRGRGNTDLTSEELMAPFASSARFAYYTNPSQPLDRPTLTAPATTAYNTIRGFQIQLPAVSPDTVPGRTTPRKATATTAVFFKNTRSQ